jgi:hypothetical protein
MTELEAVGVEFCRRWLEAAFCALVDSMVLRAEFEK